MKTPSEPVPSTPKAADDLIADITQLMAEAEEMLNESTSHHAEEKVALFAARHDEARPPQFMGKYLSAKEKLASIVRRTDETIRACPYESLAIALGVGVLVGATLRWRASRAADE